MNNSRLDDHDSKNMVRNHGRSRSARFLFATLLRAMSLELILWSQ